MVAKLPSLVELCIQTTIDNIRYIGDVGEIDIHLLKDILPHCTVDQLMHIEKSSEGRDLSPVTDHLWKRFYENHFGVESTTLVIKRMKEKKVRFKWRLLYEAKLKERDEAQQKSVDRMKQLYAEESVKKQSRQVQLCSKVPPSSKKRAFLGGTSRFFSGSSGSCNNFSNVKGNLMKKARMEFLNSHEAKVHASIRKNKLQRKCFLQTSVTRTMKPDSFPHKGSASIPKVPNPLPRRA